FDADLGDFPSLKELSGRTHERELFGSHFDLLYAYFGGRDVGGFVDFELGRQVLVDLFDYLAFDGLHVQARTPFHVAGEPWGGVVDEKLGLTARGRLLDGKIVPWFGFRYSLLAGRLDELQAGARAQLGRHGIQAEYVLSAPTFDGDSIWNVFASQAFND